MASTSAENNHYRTLGLRVGAPVWEVEEAAARLITKAGSARDYVGIDSIQEARHWLINPMLRAFHDEKLQFAQRAV